MKKLVLVFAAIAAISFASCHNDNAEHSTDPMDTVPENVVGDSLDTANLANPNPDSIAANGDSVTAADEAADVDNNK